MTHHKNPELKKRLARIEGHVKAIGRIVDEEQGYPEIVQQISAVRSALDGVTEVIVKDLLEYYVSTTTDILGKEIAIEIQDTVSRIL
jgi:CsoR family transcriptional regulator, copper-sensing transcriptional repressor